MQLYTMPGSCALACHIALVWAGADYEVVRLSHGDLRSDDFLAVNPKAKVPALTLADGSVITEALAILSHIAHAHEGADGLLPPPGVPRARMLEALSELTGEFHPAFAPLHVPGRYTDDGDGHDAVKAAARTRIRSHYDRWNERMDGRDWVLDARSAADPYLYVMCRWSGMVDAAIGDWPALARFVERVEGELGTGTALSAEELDPLHPNTSRNAA